MTIALIGGRSLATVAMCLSLSGCTETGGQQDGLFYRPPVSSGQAFVASSKTPAEVAAILREAGLGDVRSDAGSVTLVSGDKRLIDCGTMVQVALGNRAEFPANSPTAVMISDTGAPSLFLRRIESGSTINLSRQADGNGYAIAEAHTVKRRFEPVPNGGQSTETLSFNATSVGAFPNNTSCRSSGFVATLLR